MDRHGHVGITLLVFAPVAWYLLTNGHALLVVGVLVGLLAVEPLVDLDRYLPGFSHGGTSHSLLAVVVVGCLCAVGVYVFTGILVTSVTKSAFGQPLLLSEAGAGTPLSPMHNASYGFYIGAGAAVAHLLGDSLSDAGIRPFMPISSYKLSYPIVSRTGWSQFVLFVAGIVALAGVFVVSV